MTRLTAHRDSHGPERGSLASARRTVSLGLRDSKWPARIWLPVGAGDGGLVVKTVGLLASVRACATVEHRGNA